MENSRKKQVLGHISLAMGQIELGCNLGALHPADFTAEDAAALCAALREVLGTAQALEMEIMSIGKVFTPLDYDDVHDGDTEPGAH